MNYQKLLKKVARQHNTTPEEVDAEMRKALKLAGYDKDPATFIAIMTNEIKKDYIL